MSGIFITGTDTGVGKTTVSVALIQAFCRRGLRVAGMKPIAAGCESIAGRLQHGDVEALRAAANVDADLQCVNPYAFAAPVAPHIPAAEAGVEIDLEKIVAAYASLSDLADVVVVEGVGGFRVPLGNGRDTADMAQALALPVVLVVGLRLGCLNHALLTGEAMTRRNLQCAGWIGNSLERAMPAERENLDALLRYLPFPCLGTVAHGGQRDAADCLQVAAEALLKNVNISK